MKEPKAVTEWKKRSFGRGGKTTFKKYGSAHFSELSKKSWEKRRKNAKANKKRAA